VLAGLWGTASGTTAINENISAMSITRVGSRRVMHVAALCALVMGLVGELQHQLLEYASTLQVYTKASSLCHHMHVGLLVLHCFACIATQSTGKHSHNSVCRFFAAVAKFGALFASMPNAMVSG
jgi:hypothetical protein